jgi:hypothetical protein
MDGPDPVARRNPARGSTFVALREFRFDQVEGVGTRFLGWSCLLRRGNLLRQEVVG